MTVACAACAAAAFLLLHVLLLLLCVLLLQVLLLYVELWNFDIAAACVVADAAAAQDVTYAACGVRAACVVAAGLI